MKILDATTVIAIFNEINCPDLIDRILKPGHDLIIPSRILNSALLDKSTLKTTKIFVEQEKIQILEQNSMDDKIKKFQKDFPGLGLGECIQCHLTKN